MLSPVIFLASCLISLGYQCGFIDVPVLSTKLLPENSILQSSSSCWILKNYTAQDEIHPNPPKVSYAQVRASSRQYNV